jgi:hypothetical protein
MASILRDFGAARSLRVSGTDPLLGVDTMGLVGGEELTLCFVDGLTITAMGSPSFGAPIKLGGSATSLVCAVDSVVKLVLITDSGTTVFWQCSSYSAGASVSGRVHTPAGATTSTVSGCLTMPADSNNCPVGGAEDFIGVATAGWLPGDMIWLYIITARKLVHSFGSCPSGFAPFFLAQRPGSAIYDSLTTHGAARVAFQLATGSVVWNLVAGPII